MVNFRTEKVSEHITRIFGTSGELWYLVTGEEKAALLDTGSGIGHQKELLASLTDKPLIILLTHGHVDHAMGATEFDVPIYMSAADDVVYEEHKPIAKRKEGLGMAPQEIAALIEDSDYIPYRKEAFLPLEEGDVFDLGGIHVEAYACAGHTPGSMVFLIQEERTVLLGDACNTFTFMFFTYSTPIRQYRENLIEVKAKLAGKYDRVLLSHGDGNISNDIIDGVIGVCEDILNGKTDDIPFVFMGEPATIAKAMDPAIGRADGGVGNIVYNKANIG